MTAIDEAVDRLLDQVLPERLLVACDFDGTLSMIVDRPPDARPVAGAAAALSRLRERVLRVAVITGRSESALRALLPDPGLLVLGDYGRPKPTEAEARALAEFNRLAAQLVAGRPGVHVEVKPGSTSVHYRDRPASGTGLRDALAPVAARFGLDVREGRMVVEVLPGGWDKAHALRRLIEEERPGGAVYCGDDEGDRGCFELLAACALPHLAVGVRSREARPGLFAACDLVVDGPEATVRLLSRLAAAAEPPTGRPGPGREGRGPGGSASG